MSRLPDLANETLGVRVWTWSAMPDHPIADWRAGIGLWLIEADLNVFSPVVTRWHVGVIHLRPIEGQTRPAHLQFPEAGYELMVTAVDPRFGIDSGVDVVAILDERMKLTSPDADDDRLAGWLMRPSDITYQWAGTTDEQAYEVGAAFVRAALAGEPIDRPVQEGALSTLIYDLGWKRLLDGTVEHYASGHWPAIPEGRA